MRMVFLLSTLSSFLFYFAWASFILPSPVEPPIGSYEILAICLAAAFFCFCLREWKYLRFLPLAILGLLFFSLGNLSDLLLMAPLAAYVIYMTVKKKYEVSHIEFQHRFGLGGRVLVILLLLSILMSNFIDLTGVFILCLAYFVCGITLLRTLRHHEDTYSESGFVLMNFIPGIVFLIGVFMLSSGVVVSAISWMFVILRMGVYYLVLVPLTFLAGLMGPLFAWLYFPERERETRGLRPHEEPGLVPDFSEIEPGQLDPNVLRIILLVISLVGSVLFIALIIYLVKKIIITWKLPSSDMLDEDEILESSPIKTHSGWFPRFKRVSAVRRYYRRFLKLCTSQKIDIKQASTSLEVEGMVKKRYGNISDLGQLRRIYLRARYSDGEIPKEDERLARKAYKGIRDFMK